MPTPTLYDISVVKYSPPRSDELLGSVVCLSGLRASEEAVVC